MGAPNIVEDFLPDPNAVILYDPATSSPELLAAYLKQLEADDALYDSKHMGWRSKSLSERLMALSLKPQTQFQLCQVVVALKRLTREQPANSSNSSSTT